MYEGRLQDTIPHAPLELLRARHLPLALFLELTKQWKLLLLGQPSQSNPFSKQCAFRPDYLARRVPLVKGISYRSIGYSKTKGKL